ncbi:MAG: GNAT family N-acetyltransferase [archaeon]|jgi:GNAT superfamily N-acetyltransferase
MSKKNLAIKINYRRAVISDINNILELNKSLVASQKKYTWYYQLRKDYSTNMKKFIRKSIVSKNSFVGIALDNEKIIGYCNAEVKKANSITKWGKELNLIDLFVSKYYRNKGIGSKLFSFVEEFGKKKKATLMNLQVVEGNNFAEKLYIQKGMVLFKKNYLKMI